MHLDIRQGDIEAAQYWAAKLCPPEPYRRTASKPHAPVPLHVVAAELGITGEAVRQTEVRALRKCRAWCAAHGYSLRDMLVMIRR